MQWLSLPSHHLSSVQMEAQWISCHQAPSFSVTMGTAASVSCMLEAMNRELSSLIYLHIEDMEKTPLAYSAAYSDISESRRRIWALLYIRSQCPWIKWLFNPTCWDECEPQNQLWCQELSIPAGWWMKGCSWIKSAQQGGYFDFMPSGHVLPSSCDSALAYLGHRGLTCQLLNKSQHTPPKPLAWNSTHPRETS